MRKAWWGYIREILKRYPEECEEYEKTAVEKAMAETGARPNGEHKLRLITLVFFDQTHTLSGAAYEIGLGYITARRWQQEFIRCVARNFVCNGLK